MCAPTPLGSANSRWLTSRLRKLRALNRAGAAHYRALDAIASFDSIVKTEVGWAVPAQVGLAVHSQVGRRGNGPTGDTERLKPETRSGQKGIRANPESSTGCSKKERAQRVPHRWAAEVVVTLQRAEGDWKPWHQGDNPWVAVQLKPVTAGAIPAVRKAEKSALSFEADGPDALECSWRVSAVSQPRGAENQAFWFGKATRATFKGNTLARRM